MASEQPVTRTASRCPAPQTARGLHTFIIDGYSLHRGLGPRRCIQSAAFDVGGYSWCVSYYPDDHQDTMGLYATLLTEQAEVRAVYDLSLVDQTRGGSSRSFRKNARPQLALFSTISDGIRNPGWGRKDFIKWTELEESPYLRDDRLVIECVITVVFKESGALPEASLVHVPPSDMMEGFRKLAGKTVGTDVTFTIGGEAFVAHKIVLATRSPVFMAQLYGPLGEGNNRESIEVEDMQPTVFKALLHFIYTDTLPDMEHLDQEENREMTQHMLVAADRYAVERLKLICEDTLCKIVDAETAETTLALAEQHSCRYLKEACVRYIINAKGKLYVSARQCCPEPKRTRVASND